MKPFTAVVAVALGVAVWANAGAAQPRTWRTVGLVLAVGASLVAFAMLAEAVVGGIGFDGWLFPSEVAKYQLGGRMSPMTSLGFALIGLGVLLEATGRSRMRVASEVLVLAAIGTGVTGGAGYVFGPKTLSSVGAYATMSLRTALVIVSLGIAFLALRPWPRVAELLRSPTPSGRFARLMLLPITVIPLLMGRIAAESAFTLAQARTAAWAISVSVAVALAAAVLGHGVAERRREHELARTEAARERAASSERSRQVLEMMVAAADEERSKIATDLHDDTLQVMTAAMLSIDRSLALVRRDDAASAEASLRRTRATLTEAAERTRRLMFELRPPVLMESGLRAALTDLVREVGALMGADVSTSVTASRFPPDIEELAYRTTRELVTNTRKHSQAHRIAIALESNGEALVGVIGDDGVGFDLAAVRTRSDGHLHMGLDATEQRVALAGGSVVIDSTPSKGTRVRFEIPLRPTGPATASGVGAQPARSP